MLRYIGRSVEHMPRRTVGEEVDLPHFSPEQARSFKPIFAFLNDKDLDILYLIFVSEKKQKDVQKILGRTQSSLAYDIKRIRRRLKFINYLHGVFDIFLEFLRREQELENFTAEELEILTLMFYTSSFTLTARVLQTSQVRVRHSYTKCLRRMEENANSGLTKEESRYWWSIYEIFQIIRSNLNIVRRVYKGSSRRRKRKA